MNTPLFFGMLMMAVSLTVAPQNGLVDDLLMALFVLLLLLPYLFRSRIVALVTSFFEQLLPSGNRFLAAHGLMYLAILQPFALVWSAEFLMSLQSGMSHGIALMTITVTAGVFAVSGGSRAVQSVSRSSGAFLTGMILLVSANAFLFHRPILQDVDPNVLKLSTLPLSGSIGIYIAAAVLMFWMNYLESSAVAAGAPGAAWRSNAVTVIGTIVTTALLLFVIPALSGSEGAGPSSSAISKLLTFGILAGIAGLFAGTVSSAGTLAAEQLFPRTHGPAVAEKHRLVNKLAIVFSVIASVLLIPIVRNLSAAAPELFVGLLAAFAAPVVTAFIISFVARKQRPFALSFSMLFGSGLAAVDLFIMSLSASMSGTEILSLSLAGGAATAAGYVVIGVSQELVVVQRLLSLLRHS